MFACRRLKNTKELPIASFFIRPCFFDAGALLGSAEIGLYDAHVGFRAAPMLIRRTLRMPPR